MSGILTQTGAQTSTAGPITPEQIRDAQRFILENSEPHPCRLGKHLVSPTTKRLGYGLCVECGAPVGNWPTR